MKKIILILFTTCLCFSPAFAVDLSQSEPVLIGQTDAEQERQGNIESKGDIDFVVKGIYNRVTSSYYVETGSYSYSLLGGFGVAGEIEYAIAKGMELLVGLSYMKGDSLKKTLQECGESICKTTYSTEDRTWRRNSFYAGLQQNFPTDLSEVFVGAKVSYNRFYGLVDSEIDKSFGLNLFGGIKFFQNFTAEVGFGVLTTRNLDDVEYSPTLDYARNTNSYKGASEFNFGLGYSF